ncbi:acyl-CoA thioesterase [Aromatoleum toluvorans]|uniref:Acyl-CoA thioesterase n=1 Tax=Aromatoleum toluvorans TaxID=92002 RepID=A0ABX1PW88_9RHOO|nr:thioesterase family protein [Aromatoleum toluvorans]NMG42776.1 acyl-CoA thioesterase [Aromatoleum toluvorans]
MEQERKLVHTTRIPVRWGDMDYYGHVNNTVYFRFCEQARVEWIEALGFAVDPNRGEGPVVINASCTFLLPVNYPATVIVKVYAGMPGRSSVMTWYEIFVEGDERLYAEGASKVVWTDVATNKSVPIPDGLRGML